MIITPENFYFYKQITFVVVFAAVTAMQFVFPHDKNADLKNWVANLMMGAMNALLLWWIVDRAGVGLILPHNGQLNPENIEVKTTTLQIYLSGSQFLKILITVFVLDFISYLLHRMNHQVKFLWRFHAVHHSDMNLNTSTAVRFHLGEILISFGVRFSLIAVAMTITTLSPVGFLLHEVLFQFFNVFEHANLALPRRLERILEKIFVTPALHRKHHSCRPHELNSNYGTIFSFWDRLARTFTASSSQEKFP